MVGCSSLLVAIFNISCFWELAIVFIGKFHLICSRNILYDTERADGALALSLGVDSLLFSY